MGPVWIGPVKRVAYPMSFDGGKTYQNIQREVIFGTYFFVADDRRVHNRKAFTYVDLIAKVGGLFSLLNITFKAAAKVISMEAILLTVAQ
jgi:hypothetical protein